MGSLSTLFESIADNLDQRRLEFTNMRRVVLKFVGGPLESAASRLAAGSAPVLFRDTEREVNTRSNLNYTVLEDIADHLCLDISSMVGWRASLNALVNLRNNVAHGARPRGLSYKEINDYVSDTLSLMETFEAVLSEAARNRVFCTV